MIVDVHSRRSRRALTARAAASLTAVPLIAAILLRFPPDRYNFYPRCPVFLYLHLQCPGCGSTRAVAALLHGRLREALHLNAVVTLLLPLAIFYVARIVLHQKPASRAHPNSKIIYALLSITVLFTIFRNLPI